jgi:hypothetical protein
VTIWREIGQRLTATVPANACKDIGWDDRRWHGYAASSPRDAQRANDFSEPINDGLTAAS